MSGAPFRVTALGGSPALDPLTDGDRIAGYYTLVSASLLLADLPAATAKKLPRYPTV